MARFQEPELADSTRGECGIDRPWTTALPLATSTTQPPVALLGRQPSLVSVSPNAVTKLGPPSATASPLRWQRSSAASAVTNRGFHLGTNCV